MLCHTRNFREVSVHSSCEVFCYGPVLNLMQMAVHRTCCARACRPGPQGSAAEPAAQTPAAAAAGSARTYPTGRRPARHFAPPAARTPRRWWCRRSGTPATAQRIITSSCLFRQYACNKRLPYNMLRPAEAQQDACLRAPSITNSRPTTSLSPASFRAVTRVLAIHQGCPGSTLSCTQAASPTFPGIQVMSATSHPEPCCAGGGCHTPGWQAQAHLLARSGAPLRGKPADEAADVLPVALVPQAAVRRQLVGRHRVRQAPAARRVCLWRAGVPGHRMVGNEAASGRAAHAGMEFHCSRNAEWRNCTFSSTRVPPRGPRFTRLQRTEHAREHAAVIQDAGSVWETVQLACKHACMPTLCTGGP